MNTPSSSVPVRKAIIPVAGLGTRFLPATKAIPKELLPLADKPVVQYIVEEAVAAGIEEIIFVISSDKAAIERHFSQDLGLEQLLRERGKEDRLNGVDTLHKMATFVYVHQDEPLGLGHAVLQAKHVIGDEPFIVFGGDDVIESEVPAAQQLMNVYNSTQKSVIGVLNIEGEAIERYGVIAPGAVAENGAIEVKDIVEKPKASEAPSQYGIGGRWLLTPEIFGLLEQLQPDESGEVQLTDALRTIAQTSGMHALPYEGIYRDCGNKLEYIKAVISFAVQDPSLGEEIRQYIKEIK